MPMTFAFRGMWRWLTGFARERYLKKPLAGPAGC
jgi:hypothetical protein